MFSKRKKIRSKLGLSLIEVAMSMAVLSIASLGVMGYQYHVAGHTRIARAQITATQTAQLLLEDWKSSGGSTEYDPIELELGFEEITMPDEFDYGGATGAILNDSVYAVTVYDIRMEIVLLWRDIIQDASTGATIREVTVVVQYDDSPSPLILSTYIRLDAASG